MTPNTAWAQDAPETPSEASLADSSPEHGPATTEVESESTESDPPDTVAEEPTAEPEGVAEVGAVSAEPVLPAPPSEAAWHLPAGYEHLEAAPFSSEAGRAEPPPHWASGYWTGLLGMAVGTGVGIGLMFGGFAASFSGESLAPAVFAAVTAPLAVLLGTTTGVFLRGRAQGGNGSYLAAFGGTLLGGMMALIPLLGVTVIGEEGVAFIVPAVAIVAMPLMASWAYWRNSRGRQSHAEASSGVAVVPVVQFTENSGYLGAAGAF